MPYLTTVEPGETRRKCAEEKIMKKGRGEATAGTHA